MKKFLIICTILFIASVGCKKLDVNGGGLCACSPISGPQFSLIIKNSAGEDLLNENTTGFYSKSKIQLYTKDQQNKITALDFAIRPPFSYGEEKFDLNQLYVPNLSFLQAQTQTSLFLKLGDAAPYELKINLNKGRVEKLFINEIETEKGKGSIETYVDLFYFTPAAEIN